MVVKVEGEFSWHSHPDTDDFFLVPQGKIEIRLRDRVVELKAGKIFFVPKGVEHCPVARREAHLLLIEPTGTPNTSDAATAAGRKLIGPGAAHGVAAPLPASVRPTTAISSALKPSQSARASADIGTPTSVGSANRKPIRERVGPPDPSRSIATSSRRCAVVRR
ncbi:cupin domain-containing protein [Paracoccus siganidrum]|nr:cupin domain-containing protein [Paracoccus siganidrum]